LLLAFGRYFWRSRRDRRREQYVRELSRSVIGRLEGDLLRDLGEPWAILPGSTRKLYEWKSPPSRNFPPGSGLLIFYVVFDGTGRATESSWQTRQEDQWRSGTHPAAS